MLFHKSLLNVETNDVPKHHILEDRIFQTMPHHQDARQKHEDGRVLKEPHCVNKAGSPEDRT